MVFVDVPNRQALVGVPAVLVLAAVAVLIVRPRARPLRHRRQKTLRLGARTRLI